jgi:hypothetical protein
MANRRPSSDDQTAGREDEIRNPRRDGDIDEIGVTGGDDDRDLDADDDEFEDDEPTDDEETEDEDVG